MGIRYKGEQSLKSGFCEEVVVTRGAKLNSKMGRLRSGNTTVGIRHMVSMASAGSSMRVAGENQDRGTITKASTEYANQAPRELLIVWSRSRMEPFFFLPSHPSRVGIPFNVNFWSTFERDFVETSIARELFLFPLGAAVRR